METTPAFAWWFDFDPHPFHQNASSLERTQLSSPHIFFGPSCFSGDARVPSATEGTVIRGSVTQVQGLTCFSDGECPHLQKKKKAYYVFHHSSYAGESHITGASPLALIFCARMRTAFAHHDPFGWATGRVIAQLCSTHTTVLHAHDRAHDPASRIQLFYLCPNASDSASGWEKMAGATG